MAFVKTVIPSLAFSSISATTKYITNGLHGFDVKEIVYSGVDGRLDYLMQ